MADLRFGYRQIGLLVGVSQAFGQGLQWLTGYLGRFVQRKVLLGIGTVAQGVCFGLAGFSQGFLDLLVWQSLTRLAGSPQHPNGNALLLDYFGRTHRGRALAMHYAGGNLGTVLVPLVGALLLGAFGWRTTLAYFALPAIVIGLLVLWRSEEHTSELQSHSDLVCRLLLEKKKPLPKRSPPGNSLSQVVNTPSSSNEYHRRV